MGSVRVGTARTVRVEAARTPLLEQDEAKALMALAQEAGSVTKDEVLGMIIMGKCPAAAIPGPGAAAM